MVCLSSLNLARETVERSFCPPYTFHYNFSYLSVLNISANINRVFFEVGAASIPDPLALKKKNFKSLLLYNNVRPEGVGLEIFEYVIYIEINEN